MAMQIELRRHYSDWFDTNRITGEIRGPLEPDDPAYPEAFRTMRSIWIDGKLVGSCNLAPGGPINLLPSVGLVLPHISNTERTEIENFVNSHRNGAKPGRFVDPIRAIPAEGAAADEDEEDEDDDE